jgi:hypothetical protein
MKSRDFGKPRSYENQNYEVKPLWQISASRGVASF